MKKKYIQPKAETYKIEVSQMIMQSEEVKVRSEVYDEETMDDL